MRTINTKAMTAIAAALMLSGCGGAQDDSENSGISLSRQNLAPASVSISATRNISAQYASSDVQRVDITVSSNEVVINDLSLTRDEPVATIRLNPGSYVINALLKDINGTSLAGGSTALDDVLAGRTYSANIALDTYSNAVIEADTSQLLLSPNNEIIVSVPASTDVDEQSIEGPVDNNQGEDEDGISIPLTALTASSNVEYLWEIAAAPSIVEASASFKISGGNSGNNGNGVGGGNAGQSAETVATADAEFEYELNDTPSSGSRDSAAVSLTVVNEVGESSSVTQAFNFIYSEVTTVLNGTTAVLTPAQSIEESSWHIAQQSGVDSAVITSDSSTSATLDWSSEERGLVIVEYRSAAEATFGEVLERFTVVIETEPEAVIAALSSNQYNAEVGYQLSAQSSQDPSGEALAYQWSVLEGDRADFSLESENNEVTTLLWNENQNNTSTIVTLEVTNESNQRASTQLTVNLFSSAE